MDTAASPITATQCRAARGLLDWSQEQLATKAGVGLSTAKDFEAGRTTPRRSNMAAMRLTLERGGVEFLDAGETSVGGGVGVRLAREAKRGKRSND